MCRDLTVAFPDGYFLAPTVLADADNAMSFARDEIFGPVTVVIPFDGEAEAIRARE